MFNFLKSKKVVSLDRPVLVEGKDLKLRIEERKAFFNNQINESIKILSSKYAVCIEGTPKSEEKRAIQQNIHEFELKRIWLNKLVAIIKDDYEYALTISEGITLGIISEVSNLESTEGVKKGM